MEEIVEKMGRVSKSSRPPKAAGDFFVDLFWWVLVVLY